MKLSRNGKVALGVYAAALACYASASGSRLFRPSSDIHFAYQANMFLHHRLDLGGPPPSSNDWAEVEYLHLKDGRTVAGSWLRSQPTKFRELGGKVESITDTQIANRWKKYYVSFPPFPSVIFLPLVAIFGVFVNDVILTVLIAGFGPMLLFLVLRRLRARGDSERSELDDLWLTAMFGIGTVYYYSSVLGQVWYTAHVVATVLTGLFVLASFDARHPIWAGITLGAIVLTRPQMGFWGIYFLYEMWRARKPYVATLVRVGVPLAILGVVGALFNWARFHSLSEFGHSYLNVRWTDRIQRYGLFNYAFVARNLTCAFTLTPKLIAKAPFVLVSWHGMSMLLTTPALAYLLWPRDRTPLHRALWLVVAPIAIMGFMYQNDGWVQFGYRFSIDFLFAAMMLLAIGNRPLTRTFKALIVVGILVNLFGAITFNRMWQYYHDGFFPISFGEL
ncbi:MAG TPA: hypothetical protein VFF06_33660 [Polyangia bacterium]|nr:hypothetical protein [Polyangia bacterium]